MTLREQGRVSNLLHGRWLDDKTAGYAWIRIKDAGAFDEQHRVVVPVEVNEYEGGQFIPTADDELRLYESGLGDMERPVLDGDNCQTYYRIGIKKVGKKRKGGDLFALRVTNKVDAAQKQLTSQPTSPVQAPAPGAPPTGGVPTVTIPDGMHSPTTAAGPISPPPAGATPFPPAGEKAVESKETGLCGCGLDKIAVTVEQGPRRGQVVCLTCGRRVA